MFGYSSSFGSKDNQFEEFGPFETLSAGTRSPLRSLGETQAAARMPKMPKVSPGGFRFVIGVPPVLISRWDFPKQKTHHFWVGPS